MIRTLVSLDEDDKRWLDSYSRRKGQSIAETVRQALSGFRRESEEDDRFRLLESTFGIWKEKNRDAMDIIDEMRNEW